MANGVGGNGIGQAGVLQVVPPAALEAHLQSQELEKAQANQPPMPAPPELVGFIKGQFEIFRNHRNTAAGWSNRMIESLRVFNGQYSPTKMQEVLKFGGSQVYARLSAQKCRATTSLLRDIYLGPDRAWGIRPPAAPDVSPEIVQKIDQLMQQEQQMIGQTLGSPASPEDVRKRRDALMTSAEEAAKKQAGEQAKIAEDKIE